MKSMRRLSMSIFIAASAMTTGASAENIYKCGNTYSQTPCLGGQSLSVDDSRDPLQKKQQDAATQRDIELAKDLEKTRLATEQSLQTTKTKRPPTAKAHPTKVQASKEVIVLIKPKRLKQKYDKPPAFIALVPGSDHHSAPKKASKKTEPDKQQ